MSTFLLILFYVALSVSLLYASGYIGSKFGEYERIAAFELKENCQSFNLVYRILFPVVYVFICVNILEFIGIQCPNYWIIILFYWLVRFAYIIIKERYILINKLYFFITFCLSNITGFIVYTISTRDHEFLLPDRNDLVSQFWIVIILFIYKLLGEIQPLHTIDENRKRRLKNYSLNKLRKFYNSYNKIIKEYTRDIEIIKIIYSIMIVEDFNRPKAIRLVEHTFPKFFRTKGIMQVTSNSDISDEESVRIGSKIIVYAYNSIGNTADTEIDNIIEIIARTYNPHNKDYSLMIREVYNAIKDDIILGK